MANTLTEKQAQTDILEFLSNKGFPLRLNSSGVVINGRLVIRNSPYSPNGIADLFFMSNGFAYFFEVKTPTEHNYIKNHYNRIIEGNFSTNVKLNTHFREQILFLNRMRDNGAIAEFVSSVDDVSKLLRYV